MCINRSNIVAIERTIASSDNAGAKSLASGVKNASIASLDVSDSKSLDALVKDHDVVVSFIPALLHPLVAESAIRMRKNMVTASYISPAMKALHEK